MFREPILSFVNVRKQTYRNLWACSERSGESSSARLSVGIASLILGLGDFERAPGGVGMASEREGPRGWPFATGDGDGLGALRMTRGGVEDGASDPGGLRGPRGRG